MVFVETFVRTCVVGLDVARRNIPFEVAVVVVSSGLEVAKNGLQRRRTVVGIRVDRWFDEVGYFDDVRARLHGLLRCSKFDLVVSFDCAFEGSFDR